MNCLLVTYGWLGVTLDMFSACFCVVFGLNVTWHLNTPESDISGPCEICEIAVTPL